MRVHPYITPTLTAALLSAKREKGSNVWREGTRGGKKSFLFCIHRRCLSHTARRCYCELKESVRQLSLVCVRLPFSELWRSKKEPEEYNAYHRRELRPECFYVQKKTPTQTLQKINKIKNGSWEQRMKSLPYACIENYTICCYPNMRELWFSRNWIWGAIFFHLPFQVFVWRAGIEILPLLHYFQHTWRASSSTAEHM